MKFDYKDYENAPKIKCSECGREYISLYQTDKPFVCSRCIKDAEHKKEKAFITSPECDKDYEPFSTDDGYFCPYCGEFIDVDDDYEMYTEGDHDVECPCCERSFIVDTCISMSFTSRRG